MVYGAGALGLAKAIGNRMCCVWCLNNPVSGEVLMGAGGSLRVLCFRRWLLCVRRGGLDLGVRVGVRVRCLGFWDGVVFLKCLLNHVLCVVGV